MSGASASWPMHQAGQAVVGDTCLLLSSAFGCIGLPSLAVWCVVGLLGGE